MRPEILEPLFRPVTSIPGIGQRFAKLIERLAGPRVVDLLWHLPSGVIDRRAMPKIAGAKEGEVATLLLRVDQHRPPRIKRLPYKVFCSDETGAIVLVFFHAKGDYLQRALPEGKQVAVSGKIELYDGQPQITHPDRMAPAEDIDEVAGVEPIHPLTEGLPGRTLRRAIAKALESVPALPEWIDRAYLAARGWPAWREAIRQAHAPATLAELEPTLPARARLAYDELLANQLALALVRNQGRRRRGRPLSGDGRLRSKVLGALPYRLTEGQNRAIEEIIADLAAPKRMQRLLQGDVGSGKTVVAFLALLVAVEAGAQGALMAPTEILARQHFATLAPLAQAAGVRIELLTGRAKGAARDRLLADLASGAVDILLGTHALIQEDVEFKDLGLAVVDEQHRFGVRQRLAIAAKAETATGGVDVLAMTATPIPRTLLLTAYGDMEVSRLIEKPAGRQKIDTRAVPVERLDEVIAGLDRALKAGRRAYWICPLITDSEAIDLAAAEARAATLKERFGDMVGLVHGRQKSAERDAAMQAFVDGRVRLLVATTVIEVGVDVPEATIMVIEHAERFGLAQLHQLRGRVGRGAEKSSCLLLYTAPLADTAKARLSTLRETDDGFAIAEMDLKLRGPGELLGARQSGMPEFRLARLDAHADLIAVARDQARLLVAREAMTGPEAEALRALLYLFDRDDGVKLLRSA